MSDIDYERAVLPGGSVGVVATCMGVFVPNLHDRKQPGYEVSD